MKSYYSLRLFIFFVSIFSILSFFFYTNTLGNQHVSTKTTTEWGVRSTTVNTPSGKLTVNMPDDAALGDTISGTVVADPAGETPEQRQANSDTLEGYVFDIPQIPSKTAETEPEKTPGKENETKKVVTWDIPSTISGEIVDLVLRDPEGNEVTKTDLPLLPPSTYTPPAQPDAGDYTLPTIGQAGRPVEMTGPFDGEAVNTGVKIGGKETSILAQSPRKTVVESPKDVIGPTDIELTDGNVRVKDQYRSIALKLSADKLRLKRGEQTTLNVQVLGLQGLKEEIPFTLVNKSPAVVSMEGGDSQTVTVTPGEVGSEGTYTISKTLTGIQTGPFSISARIAPEYMSVPSPTITGEELINVDRCECKDMRVELAQKRFSRRFQEKLKDGSSKIFLEIPYKFKTKCTKGDIDKCVAEIKVGAEWKGGDKDPKPDSEEIHNGEAAKVTYFTKPPKPGADKNIDCSRDCPNRLSWSDWSNGLLFYEASFKKLEKGLAEKVRITLTPEKCGRGGKKSMSYDVYGCECNMISIVFPGVKRERGNKYSFPATSGRISLRKSGVRLNIPYLINTQCTGHYRAKCNASVEVEVEQPTNWKVANVEPQGNGYRAKEEGINSSKIVVKKTEEINCSGDCSTKGEPNQWNTRDVKQLKINIETDEGSIKKDDIDRHTGEFKLKLKPKYCDKVETRNEAGKDGRVIDDITFMVDIKSADWKELVDGE